MLIGFDVTPIAYSAKKAGYEVFSIDYFGDSDLKALCTFNLSVLRQTEHTSCGRLSFDLDTSAFLVMAKTLLEHHGVDGVLLSSGFEDDPHFLSALNKLAPIIGNRPSAIRHVRDKEAFFTELRRIGVDHPDTEFVRDLGEAKKKARDIGYPVIIKPEKTMGGYGLRQVADVAKLEATFEAIPFGKRFLIQEYVAGRAASASVISTASNVIILTVNEQILGKRDLGQQEPFGYCGNIVPFELEPSIVERSRETIKKTIRHFQLIGSNGVDFVITEGGVPKVVEVNPRFQGTLECVERTLSINLVQSHIEACTAGVLPTIGTVTGFCVRLILYALKRSRIPLLDGIVGIKDIPFVGTVIEEGEPLCSVIAQSSSRSGALRKARRLANSIYSRIP